jgi:hypothetical protein
MSGDSPKYNTPSESKNKQAKIVNKLRNVRVLVTGMGPMKNLRSGIIILISEVGPVTFLLQWGAILSEMASTTTVVALVSTVGWMVIISGRLGPAMLVTCRL